MHDNLFDARSLAESVRYSGDLLRGGEARTQSSIQELGERLYANELAISKEVTPDLYTSLILVLDRIGIPKPSIKAFVYPSPILEAQCYSSHEDMCVIRISSSLIELLSHHELQFVIGHEIGHFLLQHALTRVPETQRSVEDYVFQRAQELSADRIGLISCESLNVAVKALIKTASGLSDKYLRFDVGSFISQLKNTTEYSSGDVLATHPSILLRCRSLLWFSVSDSFVMKDGGIDGSGLKKIDALIQVDIDKYANAETNRMITLAKRNYQMWSDMLNAVSEKVFTRDAQDKFKKEYGEDSLESVKGFLNDLNADEAYQVVLQRFEDAKQELQTLIPHEFITKYSS